MITTLTVMHVESAQEKLNHAITGMNKYMETGNANDLNGAKENLRMARERIVFTLGYVKDELEG